MANNKKHFYIKERVNPQSGTYHVKMGQLTKAEAKVHEKTLYGFNFMASYATEEEYNKAIDELVKNGSRIH